MIIKIFTSVYKNLTNKQKITFNEFIKSNFTVLNNNNIGLEDNTIIISIVDNKKIIGCVCLIKNKILKENLILNDVNLSYFDINNNNGIFLYNLCVGKNYRNNGYAYELIELCIDFIKKYKLDYIHCHTDNIISKSLFIKNKFIENKEFKTANNNLAWSMSKYI